MKNAADQYPSQVAPKFNVRFPEGMREQIAQLAEANGRSMNSEIVTRLRESFSGVRVYKSEKTPLIEEDTSPYDANEVEGALIDIIKGMPEEEKEALLLLLKK